jgi:hypothetical protein
MPIKTDVKTCKAKCDGSCNPPLKQKQCQATAHEVAPHLTLSHQHDDHFWQIPPD